jgi:hypothetical protein
VVAAVVLLFDAGVLLFDARLPVDSVTSVSAAPAASAGFGATVRLRGVVDLGAFGVVDLAVAAGCAVAAVFGAAFAGALVGAFTGGFAEPVAAPAARDALGVAGLRGAAGFRATGALAGGVGSASGWSGSESTGQPYQPTACAEIPSRIDNI